MLRLVGDCVALVCRAKDESRREPGDCLSGEDTEIPLQNRRAGVGDRLTGQHRE